MKASTTACAIAALAVCAAAVMLAVEGRDGAPAQAQTSQQDPLDAYPGFGRTSAAAQRDDAIAAWEAFRREQHVSNCMRRAGFTYVEEMAFPEEALREVARGLGVSRSAARSVAPADVNVRARADLTAEKLNGYYLALYNETAQAIADAEASGGVGTTPEFATGGCVAEAEAAVGSIWSVYRQLQDEMDALREQVTADAGPAYADCARAQAGVAATSPGVLESLLDDPGRSGVDAARVRSAFETCTGVWETAYRAAQDARLAGFVDAHASVLQPLKDRYATALKTLSADTEFRAFLAASIASEPG
jgi:hypothetical protein